MIITKKQLVCLIDILKDSLRMFDTAEVLFIITHSQRKELYECIINQQSNKLQELKDDTQ